MKLWDLKPGQSAVIDTIEDVPGSVYSKIKNLGLQGHESVTCLRWLPFSGPRVYKLENGIFALEKDLARFIEVGS